MNHPPSPHTARRPRSVRPLRSRLDAWHRRAITTVEMIVAFTLLTSTLSVALPLVVRHDRLIAEQRHYRLALDELSNQLERLTALPPQDVTAALEALEPTELVSDRLPSVTLSGRLEAEEIGSRLTLEISWGSRPQSIPALQLVGWIAPESQPANESRAAEETP